MGNASERVSREQPTGAVLSVWDQRVSGIHAGCHAPKPGNNPSPDHLPVAALQPLPGWPVFVANEAFGTPHCWAESSLVMADAALVRMNISAIPWDGKVPPQYRQLERLSTDPFFLSADSSP